MLSHLPSLAVSFRLSRCISPWPPLQHQKRARAFRCWRNRTRKAVRERWASSSLSLSLAHWMIALGDSAVSTRANPLFQCADRGSGTWRARAAEPWSIIAGTRPLLFVSIRGSWSWASSVVDQPCTVRRVASRPALEVLRNDRSEHCFAVLLVSLNELQAGTRRHVRGERCLSLR